jgi:hypothetical protein
VGGTYCDICGIDFGNPEELFKHAEDHGREASERQSPCPFPGCERVVQRRDITSHLQTDHCRLLWKCAFCDQVFSQRSDAAACNHSSVMQALSTDVVGAQGATAASGGAETRKVPTIRLTLPGGHASSVVAQTDRAAASNAGVGAAAGAAAAPSKNVVASVLSLLESSNVAQNMRPLKYTIVSTARLLEEFSPAMLELAVRRFSQKVLDDPKAADLVWRSVVQAVADDAVSQGFSDAKATTSGGGSGSGAGASKKGKNAKNGNVDHRDGDSNNINFEDYDDGVKNSNADDDLGADDEVYEEEDDVYEDDDEDFQENAGRGGASGKSRRNRSRRGGGGNSKVKRAREAEDEEQGFAEAQSVADVGSVEPDAPDMISSAPPPAVKLVGSSSTKGPLALRKGVEDVLRVSQRLGAALHESDTQLRRALNMLATSKRRIVDLDAESRSLSNRLLEANRRLVVSQSQNRDLRIKMLYDEREHRRTLEKLLRENRDDEKLSLEGQVAVEQLTMLKRELALLCPVFPESVIFQLRRVKYVDASGATDVLSAVRVTSDVSGRRWLVLSDLKSSESVALKAILSEEGAIPSATDSSRMLERLFCFRPFTYPKPSSSGVAMDVLVAWDWPRFGGTLEFAHMDDDE